jgi:hypothetical protein
VLLCRPKARADGHTYNFSWTYRFAEPPRWSVERLPDGSGVTFEQRVSHQRWGWAIRRKISVCGGTGGVVHKKPALCIDLKLTNTGEMPIRTPYASGNAFNLAAGPPTGKKFAVTFGVPGSAYHYDHGKGAHAWAVPLHELADVKLQTGVGVTRIAVNRALGEDEQASVNFNVTNTTWNGQYTVIMPAAPGWNLFAKHSVWRDATTKRSGWYGFNVRISRRAISPRPFLLLDLQPGQTIDLSHKYEFEWKPAKS